MMDLLLANYSDVGYILDMDCVSGLQMIVKAKERQEDARQWLLYCNLYPHFTKETFQTFDQFCGKNPVAKIGKSKEVIVDEVKKMRKKHGWK